MATLLRERYELLEVAGQGGEGRVLRALDHQHDRIVALKVRQVTSGSRPGGAPVRGPDPAGPAAPSEPAPGAGGLLRGRPVRHRHGLGRGHGPLEARAGRGPARSGAVAGDALAGRRGRGADPPAHPGPAGRARRREAGQPDPHPGGTGHPGRLRPLVGAPLAATARRDPGLRRPGAGGERPRPAGRATSTRSPPPPSPSSPVGRRPGSALRGTASTRPRRPSWRTPSGRAWRPTRCTGRRPPGELVERLRAGWGATLPTGVLTFCLTEVDDSTAKWDAHPEEMARGPGRPRPADRHRGRSGAGGRFLTSNGDGDATVSVFTAPGAAVAAALDLTRADVDRAGRRRGPSVTGGTAHGRGGAAGCRLRRADAEPGGPPARPGGWRAGAPLAGHRRRSSGDHLPPGASLVDLGPHRLHERQRPRTGLRPRRPGHRDPARHVGVPLSGPAAVRARRTPSASSGGRSWWPSWSTLAPTVPLRGRRRRPRGSGKSSLLRAGLAPAVGGADVVTPGAIPWPSLDEVADGPRLLVVDQFEEVFTLCGDEAERTVFLDRAAWPARARWCSASAPTSTRAAPGTPAWPRPSPAPSSARPDERRRAAEGDHRAGATRPGCGSSPGSSSVLVGEVGGEPGALPLLVARTAGTWEPGRTGR